MTTSDSPKLRSALILGGGGARAAYQVGVLKAVAELVPQGSNNPFPIVCGTSAGSINTVALASNASDFHLGVERITQVWSNFELHHVFYADAKNLLKRITSWVWSNIGPGNWDKGPSSLLDNQPLRELLNQYISFEKIDNSIRNGDLHGYCLTACSYDTGESTTFYDGDKSIEDWRRTHREGIRTKMSIEHLMASSAIPVIFPSVELKDEHFGDGSMRQLSPISPALHLGAEKILIIGLRKESKEREKVTPHPRPTLGQISGYILDTLFLNSLQSDIERMERVNRTLEESKECKPDSKQAFRLALKFLGLSKGNSRRFISYLMFTKTFCDELIGLGYRDAMAQQDELSAFLKK